MANDITIKVKLGAYLYPLTLKAVGAGSLELHFAYNKDLITEIKAMEGAKYHGYDETNPRKIWTIKNSPRNRFQLAYLGGGNPYAQFEKPLTDFIPSRKILFPHQIEAAKVLLTTHAAIVAYEMGLGKTLAIIETMEQSGHDDWFYVAPRSALYSVQLEFDRWSSKVRPRFYTYEALKKLIEEWPKDKKPPQGVVFDEASRCKNPTAQRSQAALILANMSRDAFKEDAWVILMSGSPAPKSPVDWYHLCEIVCPGFLREGDIHKFKKRLAIIQQKESIAGGVYPHLVTWKDDSNKCADCGKLKEDIEHNLGMGGHSWIASKNEVAYLYERMKGLVLVKFKKDCLDLPPLQYKVINLKPSQEILNAASLIVAKSPTTIQALTLLRELSDGFQYREQETNEDVICPICKGTEIVDDWINEDSESEPTQVWIKVQGPCQHCINGKCPKIQRIAIELPSPKEQALEDLLDQHEEIGRLVVYAGFTGSVDRCVKIIKKTGWEYLRVDGRGWENSLGLEPLEALKTFQENKSVEKFCFIAQPSSGGMGLTLTASPSIVYYSNDFNGESRIQSEARIHRPGMDKILGATIYDLVHLPADQLVLDNLRKKIKLQNLSLGQLEEVLR